jgi:hypothetical protein
MTGMAGVSSVSPLFADTLANEFGFGERENEFRTQIHGFMEVCRFSDKNHAWNIGYQMGRGLSKPDLATRAFLLAALSRSGVEQRKTEEMNRQLHSMVTDLAIRLDDNFALTNEQKVFLL